MNRLVTVFFVIVVLLDSLSAQSFFDNLNRAQRYDLADAYNEVSNVFDGLEQPKRAEEYRKLSGMIFPDFKSTPSSSAPLASPEQSARKEPVSYDREGMKSSSYYFDKLIGAVNTENLSRSLSVLANNLYVTGYDSAIKKSEIASLGEDFFEAYDLKSIRLEDVFDIQSKEFVQLIDSTWRIDIDVQPAYQDVFPGKTFWGRQMSFYFRFLKDGWRLVAIGAMR